MKKKRSPVVDYILTSLSLFGFQLLFSVISLVFAFDAIPTVVRVIMGFVFIVPQVALAFLSGKRSGEKLFKEKVKKISLTDIHSGQAISFEWYRSIFHVLFFVCPLLILIVLAVCLNSVPVRGFVYVCFFPVSLIFESLNVMPVAQVTPLQLAIYIPAILLPAIAFVIGYVISFLTMKRRQGEIMSELRSFDN